MSPQRIKKHLILNYNVIKDKNLIIDLYNLLKTNKIIY